MFWTSGQQNTKLNVISPREKKKCNTLPEGDFHSWPRRLLGLITIHKSTAENCDPDFYIYIYIHIM